MPRYMLIESGVATNAIEVINPAQFPQWTLVRSDTANINDRYDAASGKFSPPPRDLNAEWSVVRAERARLLSASDWTQIADTPLDATKRNEWRIYRQALRDITNQSDPANVIWPVPPQGQQ